MNNSQRPDPLDAHEHRKVPRRDWLIVPGLAALGLLAAAAYLAIAPAAAPRVYTATAAVNVMPPGQGIALIPGQVLDLRPQAQAARSVGVAAIAARMMHGGLSPRALSKKVTVTVPPDSLVLDIACAGQSASRAATCADDYAKAYLKSPSLIPAKLVDVQVNALREKVTSLSQAMAALRAKIAALPPNSPRRAAYQAQLRSDHGQLRAFTGQIKAAAGELTNSGSIVTLATSPGKPGGSSTLPVLLSGLAAGLLLGVMGALLLGRRVGRIPGAG